jgi:hypothetical protein
MALRLLQVAIRLLSVPVPMAAAVPADPTSCAERGLVRQATERVYVSGIMIMTLCERGP